MSTQTYPFAEVAEAILCYLDEHPDAADTAEGITKWWLPAKWDIDDETVRMALAHLMNEGLVHQRENIDRHVLIYSGVRHA